MFGATPSREEQIARKVEGRRDLQSRTAALYSEDTCLQIAINYLQVVAIAISINSNWSEALARGFDAVGGPSFDFWRTDRVSRVCRG